MRLETLADQLHSAYPLSWVIILQLLVTQTQRASEGSSGRRGLWSHDHTWIVMGCGYGTEGAGLVDCLKSKQLSP